MTPNFWFAVIHVLQKLKLFKPYTKWIENFLAYLDDSVEVNLREAQEWINNTENPTLAGLRTKLGYGWEHLVTFMIENGDITLDKDRIINNLEDSQTDL